MKLKVRITIFDAIFPERSRETIISIEENIFDTLMDRFCYYDATDGYDKNLLTPITVRMELTCVI